MVTENEGANMSYRQVTLGSSFIAHQHNSENLNPLIYLVCAESTLTLE